VRVGLCASHEQIYESASLELTQQVGVWIALVNGSEILSLLLVLLRRDPCNLRHS